MPPWRGFRQVLAVGPWGKVIDKVNRKATKLLLKTTNTSQVLFVVRSEDGMSTTSDLVDKKDLPPKAPNTLRIVAVSDTHGKHRFVPIPEGCDILIHCGDILQRYGYAGDLGGGLPALYDFRSWLRSLKIPYKVFIGGNHDRLLEELGDDRIREIFQKVGGGDDNTIANKNNNNNRNEYQIHYLRDSLVQIEGLTIYGSPWSPKGETGNSAFQRGSTAASAAAATTTEVNQWATNNDKSAPLSTSTSTTNIDILMTHAKCSGWKPILGSHNVQLWVHGHWHYDHGRAKVLSNNGCVSVNVASNDMIYRPKNPPIVMDVSVRQ